MTGDDLFPAHTPFLDFTGEATEDEAYPGNAAGVGLGWLGIMSRFRRTSGIAVVAALGLLTFGVAPAAHAAPGDVVVFDDSNLEACVAAETGVAVGAITEGDMALMTSLYCFAEGVTDIAPLVYATSLENLSLHLNQITDVSPLNGLTNLRWLGLESNQITDVSPLSSLTNLQGLVLSTNQITDVSPLGSLTDLIELDLRRNQVTDVSALSGLTNLEILDLSENQISDVSPLSSLTNLMRLWLDENQITDVSPLATLTALTNGDLRFQTAPQLAATINTPTAHAAVKDPTGTAITPTIDTGTGTVASDGTVTWTALGTGSLEWQSTFTIGTASVPYSATQSFTISAASLSPTNPIPPVRVDTATR